jgi:hypothetical protein
MPTATRCREAEVCLVRVVLPGAAKQGIFPFSIAEFFDKGITISLMRLAQRSPVSFVLNAFF